MKHRAVIAFSAPIMALGFAFWSCHPKEEADSFRTRLEALVAQRASQAEIERDLGPPAMKGGASDRCAEEWTYNMVPDRRAILCFDMERRAEGFRTVRSFDRRDF